MNPFQVGDRVMPADAGPDSLPAYRDMRGTVAEICSESSVRVAWDYDNGDKDVFPRNIDTIKKEGVL